ncbi:Outer membrane lipoprotein [Lysobacter dokdonensis DS-58]|uniref:Outer membrane lipoprotein n=1 Tax=Lysobacter dokdonensis DS-58 TaxID=1300345 RepID=A0A0A2X563_9GAMM|nr:glycine zipper 2TM domain-containing protein [Lysobacter dokdonensis]KGQ20414.1 Outer membrane lipoprotein [Lysobacter dokdonensis DS-58]
MKMQMLAAAAVATLALAGCASTSPSYNGSTSNNGYNTPPQSCYDCGRVTRIDAVGGQQTSGATGAVLGGVVGAVAGHELAKDSSKGRQNTATIAGAAAGAVAGNAIQKNMNKASSYNVFVQMDNGQTVTVNQTDLGSIREGSYVRVYNGRAWAN